LLTSELMALARFKGHLEGAQKVQRGANASESRQQVSFQLTLGIQEAEKGCLRKVQWLLQNSHRTFRS
jgi:hypothetical protein